MMAWNNPGDPKEGRWGKITRKAIVPIIVFGIPLGYWITYFICTL